MPNNITLKSTKGEIVLMHDGNELTFKSIKNAIRFAAMLKYVIDGTEVRGFDSNR